MTSISMSLRKELLGRMLGDAVQGSHIDIEHHIIDLLIRPPYDHAMLATLTLEEHARAFGELPWFAAKSIEKIIAAGTKNPEFSVLLLKSLEPFEERHVLYFVRRLKVEWRQLLDWIHRRTSWPVTTVSYPLVIWTQDGKQVTPQLYAKPSRFPE
jgi:hypothetical protein